MNECVRAYVEIGRAPPIFTTKSRHRAVEDAIEIGCAISVKEI